MDNPLLCISTLGGFVYCMSTSSIDSSHVAVGLGDCSIRIWNMAAGNPEMNMIWNGIKGILLSIILISFNVCWESVSLRQTLYFAEFDSSKKLVRLENFGPEVNFEENSTLTSATSYKGMQTLKFSLWFFKS